VKRDPIVIIVVAMVVTVMLVFGLQMARRNSGGGRCQHRPQHEGRTCPRLHARIARWENGSALRLPRQRCVAEFLGNLVPALQDRNALVWPNCRRSMGRKDYRLSAWPWTMPAPRKSANSRTIWE